MRRLPVPLLALLAAAPAAAAPPPNRDDAPLRCVRFADRREGWACGDAGTVWHTIDGGATWERQIAPTAASLRAMHFLTPYTGWAVGRSESPNGSGGVVLATEDGGATWSEVSAGATSGLNAVHFFDEKRGVAAGDGTAAYPSGLFATADGGRSWAMVPGPRAAAWLAADWAAPADALLAGAAGRLAKLSNGALKPGETDPLKGVSLRALARDGARAVAVGDAGSVLTSADAGRTWGFAQLPVSDAAARLWDLAAVSKAGTHLWAVGRPGSAVLHSPDAGRTWELQKTGHPVPLHGVYMVDEQTGWACGDLGTVLHTANGGVSWTVQRCGGQRAALLFAQSRPGLLPLGVAAKVGADDGYLTVGLAASADPADECRVQAAVRAAGGAAGECRPADADPLPRLVAALRTWRPDVVAADPLTGESGESRALLAAAQDAFKRAADPAEFPELRELGLEPHAARKLYAQDAGPEAAARYDLAAFCSALGDAPRDSVCDSARLLNTGVAPDSFRLVSTRVEGAAGHPDLMTGVALAEGGTARRKRPAARPELEGLMRQREEAARAAGRVTAMLGATPTDADAARLTAGAAGELAKLPDDLAARACVGLGQQMARAGRWVQARELFALAVTKYPGQPESADALRWLAAYTASSEARRRATAAPEWGVRQTSFTDVSKAGVPTAKDERSVSKVAAPDLAPTWARACLGYEAAARGHGDALARDPALLMAFLAAKRQAGLYGDAAESLKAAARHWGGFAHDAPGVDPWKDCVAAELWLGNPESVPAAPKPLAVSAGGAAPALDGKLDDACWRAAAALPLAGGPGAGEVKFAHDDKCLYVAVRCGHAPRAATPKASNRRHDMPISADDSVEILLDLDRDYQTAYRLRVDASGAVADDCWGDAGWNPRWFVAVESGATEWVAEVAVPWEELTSAAPAPGQVWAANVVRLRVGQPAAAWGRPADGRPRPEAMGLLRFAAGK